MIAALKDRLLQLQRRLTATFGTDISTPEARRAAWWHFQLMDHAFLRVLWTNLHQVAPGVWRANQPSPQRLRQWQRALGLKSVMNLRGTVNQGFYLFEDEMCRDLGLTLFSMQLGAKQAAPRERLVRLIDALKTLPKPLLIHCKSGSDRTGLAAALYLIVVEGRPVAEAQRQLSWRYLHIERSRAGIQDHILRLYAKANAETGIGFEAWLNTDYDPANVSASFKRWQTGVRSLA